MNMPFDVVIHVLIDKSCYVLKLSSHIRAYHAYMDMWTPLISDDTLFVSQKKIIIMTRMLQLYCITTKFSLVFVDRVPVCYLATFLLLPNHSIGVCVKRKMNYDGAGYGLEIPTEYIFYVNEKIIQSAKRTLDGADNDVNEKLLRCLKQDRYLKKTS